MRQFQQLARMAEADGHLQQRIKQLLKLSKEKWDAACEHAKTAVQVCTATPPVTITALFTFPHSLGLLNLIINCLMDQSNVVTLPNKLVRIALAHSMHGRGSSKIEILFNAPCVSSWHLDALMQEQ